MKVSPFTKKKNNYGKVFVPSQFRENVILNHVDQENTVHVTRTVSENAVNNWERTFDGSKIWSF